MIWNLDKISTGEFLLLNDQQALPYWYLQSMFNFTPRFGNFKAKRLGELEFGEIANIKSSITKTDFERIVEIFTLIFGIKRSQFINAPVTDFLNAIGWLRLSIEELIIKEYNALKSDTDPDMQAAGVERLSVFAEMNTLIGIGQQYGKSPQEIETWPYNMVFTLMLHNKILSEVQKNYSEIKSKAK
ncbi:hypothetical protein [Leeuwenhoekiella nanhaiensis]|uniref:Uncharacterized protein n=1 Tax=Leeuwenhoekiella nanhaiensis TaxID=1655491 RepID=A0A2G1VMN4_9FLAO|nr:hypothetical protein [Leeuwenhoekiella nanhaiensis]PHQ27860.1 hypothetical protein CJ305_17805 [Leeuwenhoekiella nanhaiensis]